MKEKLMQSDIDENDASFNSLMMLQSQTQEWCFFHFVDDASVSNTRVMLLLFCWWCFSLKHESDASFALLMMFFLICWWCFSLKHKSDASSALLMMLFSICWWCSSQLVDNASVLSTRLMLFSICWWCFSLHTLVLCVSHWCHLNHVFLNSRWALKHWISELQSAEWMSFEVLVNELWSTALIMTSLTDMVLKTC